MRVNVLFAVLVSVLSLGSTSNLPAKSGKLGIFFKYEIDPADFGGGSSPLVEFQSSQVAGSDLPSWLRLEQNDPDDPAFIYGTPEQENVTSVKLQITGWNKKNYNTMQKFLTINIDTAESPPRYQADFKVVNKNIDKFLNNDDETEFLTRVDELKWQDAVVTKVEGAPDRGGRYPLPGDPFKEGVYITVGSPREYQILEDATECRGLPNNPFNVKPRFNVDWCELTLIDREKVNTKPTEKEGTVNTSTGFVTALSFEPVEYDDSRRDLLIPFILVIIIPLLIGIILFILLSVIMFGGREGVAVRDGNTPQEQIVHHHSIRRATFRLREMSKPQPMTETDAGPTPPPARNNAPPPSESGSEAGESDRSAPPPYRMPPTFPAGSPGNTRQQPPPFMRSGSMS